MLRAEPLRLRVLSGRLTSSECRTRIPFRFGATALEQAPLLTLRLEVEGADGRRAYGFAADLCVPRWFEKDPARDARDDARRLIDSARAALAAVERRSASVLELSDALWRARVERLPAGAPEKLLRGFGAALVERALIDGACRLDRLSFFEAVRSGRLGFVPEGLPAQPLRSIPVRHTVGLGDRLRRTDIPAGARLDDGFPECLEEDIERHGFTRFKLKLGGVPDADRARLLAIAAVLEERCPAAPVVTLDANEQYPDLTELRSTLEAVRADALGARLLARLAWIEQPLPRALTLDPAANRELPALSGLAPLVIDEADDGTDAFPRAAELGYRGVSVKNCKGVLRALRNRALCAASQGVLFQTGEDLTNLPVLALQQDLATQALLGLADVERNGQHYFRGLAHLPRPEAEAALAAHPDLYQRQAGAIALRIASGQVALGSLDRPGYGYDLEIRDDLRTPVA
jgi:hypothetical protein